MKFVLVNFLIFFSISLYPNSLKTKIKEVRVFSGSAFVTRLGNWNPSGTAGYFYIDELPPSLEKSSISIRFPGKEKIRIKKLHIEKKIQVNYQNEKAKQAQEDYDKLSREIQVLNRKFEEIKNYKNLLQNLKPKEKKTNLIKSEEIKIRAEHWIHYNKVVSQILAENYKKEIEILSELDELNEKLLVAETRLNYYKHARRMEVSLLRVEYETSLSGNISFELEYRVSDVNWLPYYEVRVDRKQNRSRLLMYAVMRNNTGEDWKNVRLFFSTTSSNTDISLPGIKEERIAEREVEEKELYAKKPSARRRASGFSETASARGLTATESPRIYAESKEEDVYEVADERKMDRKQMPAREMAPEPAKPVQTSSKIVDYGQIQVERKKKSRQILQDNLMAADSIQAEDNLSQIISNLNEQRSNFSSNDFDTVLDAGRKAKAKIRLLKPVHRQMLYDAEKEISDLNQRASAEKNSKIPGLQPLNALSLNFISKGSDYRYRSLGKETLISDNSLSKVLIGDYQMKANLKYEASPVQDESTYLVATSFSKSSEPLLKGPMAIYVEQDFIAQSELQTTLKGEKIVLHIGRDEDIEVKRKINEFRSVSGIFSKTKNIKYTVELQIKNRKKSSASLLLVDRVPFTEDSKVEIKLMEKPSGMKEEERGILKMQLDLKPGEVRKLEFIYSVSIPDGHILEKLFNQGEI
ncbi:MAG: DUF4139 domain-containing protein [Leptospiraceae bacterium]|nr:DUF4139 domain-containing protein [Leptospiraceae bacterium]MCP5500887.1 DUF4139 domain-containing protein [Leptospiraceae bacterium]